MFIYSVNTDEVVHIVCNVDVILTENNIHNVDNIFRLVHRVDIEYTLFNEDNIYINHTIHNEDNIHRVHIIDNIHNVGNVECVVSVDSVCNVNSIHRVNSINIKIEFQC